MCCNPNCTPHFGWRAEEVASTLGYLCFALDVYGTGVRATDDAEAGLLMDALLADPAELHARIQVRHPFHHRNI